MATAPFYGDPATKARVWSKYAVLLGDPAATVPTTNAAFTLNDLPTTSNQWNPVGSLTADTPFDDGAESISQTDHSAAGFGVYATSSRDQKESVTFNAKETTLVTLGIMYDATGITDVAGVISGTLKLRDPSRRFMAAFQRENATQMERRITKNYAFIETISKAFSGDESIYTVTLGIAPAADGSLYTYYLGAK